MSTARVGARQRYTAYERRDVIDSVTPHVGLVRPRTDIRVELQGRAALPEITSTQRAVRRGMDVAIAVVAIILLASVMVLIALMIRCTSRGPIFFMHERVGRNHERFRVIKFRTMLHGTNRQVMADPEEFARYAENGYKLPPDDRRITRLGRLLRRSSLDELPQLFNVLTGKMSIVGVRPLVPSELAARSSFDQALYAQFEPGMTGLWQVRGRSSVGGDNRVGLDREYLRTWSIRGDLKILLQTPAALLRLHHSL